MSNMSSQHNYLSIQIPQKILIGNQLSWRSRLIRWSYQEVNIRIPKTAGMIIQIHGNTVVSKAVLISMVWDSRLHTESTRADATRIFLLIHLRHWWNRCIYAKERTANIVKKKAWSNIVSQNNSTVQFWNHLKRLLCLTQEISYSSSCSNSDDNPFSSLYSILSILPYILFQSCQHQQTSERQRFLCIVITPPG